MLGHNQQDQRGLPLEWVEIPGGVVTLKAGGYLEQDTVFQVAPFAIAKYPVTNAGFAAFMDAGGYTDRTWWSDAGWQRVRLQQDWHEPRFWRDRDMNGADCPVVGVSWYEAQAYCRWLAALTGLAIRLPAEQEWQFAAQGSDGREYPWGNAEPGHARGSYACCNWGQAEEGTTPVTRYPAGASPFGVMDMSGNAWEWCGTSWASGSETPEGSEPRVLRGGSWVSDSTWSLAAPFRYGTPPHDWGNHTIGFRCTLAR